VTRFVATENNKGQSTVRLGDLYSVRMKLVQSEIQTSRARIRETRDFKIHSTDIGQGIQLLKSLVKDVEGREPQVSAGSFSGPEVGGGMFFLNVRLFPSYTCAFIQFMLTALPWK
jgi:hypothetical protein